MKKMIWNGLIVIGTGLLPLLSLYLGSRSSLLYENITYVGSMETYHTVFIIWGVIQSFYYLLSYLFLIQDYPFKSGHYHYLSIFLTTISILSFLSPYTLDSGDLFSQFHVYGAMISCIGMLLLLYHTIHQMHLYDASLFPKGEDCLKLISMCSMMLLVLIGDISTLMELLLINGLNIIMSYFLLAKNKKAR